LNNADIKFGENGEAVELTEECMQN
jgi:hypothetical protein